MTLHPIMAAALAPFAPVGSVLRQPDMHRGWTISYDYPPIPCRDFDWSATSPDYDASYEGPEDGWVASGEIVRGATREAVIAEIDALLDDATCDCGAVTNNAAPVCDMCLAEYRAERADQMEDF